MSASVLRFPVAQTAPNTSELSRTGRVECYRHSDSISQNKGGAMVRVLCDTDFAARTETFSLFAREVAKFAYAASAASWNDIVRAYPEMGVKLIEIRKTLLENVVVTDVVVLKV